MMLYTAQTRAWKELKQFDVSWGYWIWSSDSKSIYMAVTPGTPGVYRLSIPDGKWEFITRLDGINVTSDGMENFLSLTVDGRPAIMSDTSVVQIYSAKWTKESDSH